MSAAPASRRSRGVAVLAAIAAIAVSVTVAPAALATPPNIPSKATAQSELNGLTVTAEGSMTGYSRDLFPTPITISGTCNTREWVLKRDGTSVIVGGDCAPTSGTISPSSGVDKFTARPQG